MHGPDLAGLVVARMCHDLLNPIGAIGNGLELLALAGVPQSPELGVVDEGQKQAVARLRYFRLAFGGPKAGVLRADDISAVCNGMFGATRFSVSWQPGQGEPSQAQARLLLLLLLCVQASLPLGGTAVAGKRTIVASGPRVAPPSELWAWVCRSGNSPVIAPATIQFALARQALDETGQQLDFNAGDEILSLALV